MIYQINRRCNVAIYNVTEVTLSQYHTVLGRLVCFLYIIENRGMLIISKQIRKEKREKGT